MSQMSMLGSRFETLAAGYTTQKYPFPAKVTFRIGLSGPHCDLLIKMMLQPGTVPKGTCDVFALSVSTLLNVVVKNIFQIGK